MESYFVDVDSFTAQVAHYLTLVLTTSSVFLSAWTILGPIAAPGTVLYCTVLYCTVLYCTVGGTVFALLVLIVLALLGGQIIKLLGGLLTKVFRVNIALPPLLGEQGL